MEILSKTFKQRLYESVPASVEWSKMTFSSIGPKITVRFQAWKVRDRKSKTTIVITKPTVIELETAIINSLKAYSGR